MMKDKTFSEFFRGLRKNKWFRLTFVVMIAIFLMTLIFPGWLVCHKPSFRGRITDAETGRPIEGAVVVAIYYKRALARHLIIRVIASMLGGNSRIIEVREALSDENGDFRIPSYTTIINPLSHEGNTDFIIFKPGYGGLPTFSDDGMERFFSENFGKKGEIRDYVPYEGTKMVPVIFGMAKLPRLKTWEQRWKANISSIDFPKGRWPLLRDMVKKEREWLFKNEGWRR